MNTQMQDLMQQLGDAVHSSLEGSKPMAAILDDIKRAGYAVEISVDAKFSSDEEEDVSAVAVSSATAAGPPGDLQLSDVDRLFLRALNITA